MAHGFDAAFDATSGVASDVAFQDLAGLDRHAHQGFVRQAGLDGRAQPMARPEGRSPITDPRS